VELIFADPYYDSPEEESGRFARELRAELAAFDPSVEVVEADIGRGADWPVVLAELFRTIDWPSVASTAGPIAVFFLGEKIQRNSRAWLEMAGQLKQLLIRRPATRIDEKAALLLVIDQLSNEKVSLSNVEVSVQVVEHVTLASGRGTLDKRSEAVYVIAVCGTGESRLFVVEADGTVALQSRYAERRLR
jgi:hypothetical protein